MCPKNPSQEIQIIMPQTHRQEFEPKENSQKVSSPQWANSIPHATDAREIGSPQLVNPIPLWKKKLIAQFNDLDVPIVLKKGMKTCTQHPTSNYLSNSILSSSFMVFT